MRSSLALAFVMLAAACGTEPMGDDDGMGSGSGSGSGSGNDGTPAFTVQSKDVVIDPGQEITYCYYFTTPNDSPVVVRKWTSDMTEGSHHLIMFNGTDAQAPDDTLDPSGDCNGGGTGLNAVPIWVYAAQTPHGELPMPADDGAGKPLGMEVAAHQKAYFQMHYLNSTDEPITAHVSVNAYAYDAGTEYTPTAAYITYNNDISIPKDAVGHEETQTCNVPSGVKFWTVSTHSHKQSVMTEIKDGTSMVFHSEGPDAWEHPGAKTWDAMPFYTFGSNKLTYTCRYDNTGTNHDKVIEAGPSAQFNEMCMATGYMFPATKAKFCLTNLGPF